MERDPIIEMIRTADPLHDEPNEMGVTVPSTHHITEVIAMHDHLHTHSNAEPGDQNELFPTAPTLTPAPRRRARALMASAAACVVIAAGVTVGASFVSDDTVTSLPGPVASVLGTPSAGAAALSEEADAAQAAAAAAPAPLTGAYADYPIDGTNAELWAWYDAKCQGQWGPSSDCGLLAAGPDLTQEAPAAVRARTLRLLADDAEAKLWTCGDDAEPSWVSVTRHGLAIMVLVGEHPAGDLADASLLLSRMKVTIGGDGESVERDGLQCTNPSK